MSIICATNTASKTRESTTQFKIVVLTLLLVCNAEKTIPDIKLGLEEGLDGGDRSQQPLVKYGVNKKQFDPHHGSQLGIIGGRSTNITEHPYQVAIDKGHTFVCAGALLNRIWVVALASCTDGAHPSDLTVRVGSNRNIFGGTVYNVSDIIIHPNFNYTVDDYDFSLLKLNTYMCFDKDVTQIDFSLSPPGNHFVGTISGWGSDGKNSSTKFRQLSMRTIYNKWCASKYQVTRDTITSRMFCAVAGHSGPCYDDFGDPFVVNGTLFGLFSWSRGCANPNYPAVFSNLASVKDWIHFVMNTACTCGLY